MPKAQAPLPKTKTQIIAALAEKSGATKAQAKAVLEELVALAVAGAKKDPKGFVVPGLGKLAVKKRPARTGRNPATGETIQIKAKKVAKFTIAKAVKDAVL